MSSLVFRGDAQQVTDVWRYEVGSDNPGEVFKINRNGKTISVAQSLTLSTDVLIAAEMVRLLGISTEPEFFEYTWAIDSGATTEFTGTQKEGGIPATFTHTGTTGTGGIAVTTAAAGPSFWSANNFDTGSLPVNGDSVYLFNTDTDVLYNLGQSAVTLAVLDVSLSYEGNIGNPEWNTSGSRPYLEDRDNYLAISATLARLGTGSGNGGGHWNLNFGTNATTCYVYGSGSSDDRNYFPIRLKGVHATNSLIVLGGEVDVAPFYNDTATFPTIRVSGSGRVRCGAQVTMTTVEVLGSGSFSGYFIANSITTLTMRDNARVLIDGTNAGTTITTANVYSGRLDYRAKGTIATLTLGPQAVFDATNCPEGVTITNCTRSAGSTILDPNKKITFTNPITYSNCGVEDCPNDRLGKGITIARA